MIAGQGTVGLEIARQASVMGVVPDALICCCGGGGLIAGTSIALHGHFPETESWSGAPDIYDATKRASETGARERAEAETASG